MTHKGNRGSHKKNHLRQDRTRQDKQAKADNIHTNKGISSKQRYAIRKSREKTSQGVQTSFVRFFFFSLDFSHFLFPQPYGRVRGGKPMLCPKWPP